MHPPTHIDGARVLQWAWSEIAFGMVGKTAIHGLALCRYDGAQEIYRFSCNRHWNCEQDAPYGSVHEAKSELPVQYRRVDAVWQCGA